MALFAAAAPPFVFKPPLHDVHVLHSSPPTTPTRPPPARTPIDDGKRPRPDAAPPAPCVVVPRWGFRPRPVLPAAQAIATWLHATDVCRLAETHSTLRFLGQSQALFKCLFMRDYFGQGKGDAPPFATVVVSPQLSGADWAAWYRREHRRRLARHHQHVARSMGGGAGAGAGGVPLPPVLQPPPCPDHTQLKAATVTLKSIPPSLLPLPAGTPRPAGPAPVDAAALPAVVCTPVSKLPPGLACVASTACPPTLTRRVLAVCGGLWNRVAFMTRPRAVDAAAAPGGAGSPVVHVATHHHPDTSRRRGTITSAALHPSLNWAATSSSDGSAVVWSGVSGAVPAHMFTTMHAAAVHTADFVPAGVNPPGLVTHSADGVLAVHNLHTAQTSCVVQLPAASRGCTAVHHTASSFVVATGQPGGGGVSLWDLRSGGRVARLGVAWSADATGAMGVCDVAFLPSTGHMALVATHPGGFVSLWDLRRTSCVDVAAVQPPAAADAAQHRQAAVGAPLLPTHHLPLGVCAAPGSVFVGVGHCVVGMRTAHGTLQAAYRTHAPSSMAQDVITSVACAPVAPHGGSQVVTTATSGGSVLQGCTPAL